MKDLNCPREGRMDQVDGRYAESFKDARKFQTWHTFRYSTKRSIHFRYCRAKQYHYFLAFPEQHFICRSFLCRVFQMTVVSHRWCIKEFITRVCIRQDNLGKSGIQLQNKGLTSTTCGFAGERFWTGSSDMQWHLITVIIPTCMPKPAKKQVTLHVRVGRSWNLRCGIATEMMQCKQWNLRFGVKERMLGCAFIVCLVIRKFLRLTMFRLETCQAWAQRTCKLETLVYFTGAEAKKHDNNDCWSYLSLEPTVSVAHAPGVKPGTDLHVVRSDLEMLATMLLLPLHEDDDVRLVPNSKNHCNLQVYKL